MADELGISKSAYSKIETGSTDPSVKRIQAIAKILEVDVTYFFQESPHAISKAEEQKRNYGYATKNEIEDLARELEKLRLEMASLKNSLSKAPVKKKKKA